MSDRIKCTFLRKLIGLLIQNEKFLKKRTFYVKIFIKFQKNSKSSYSNSRFKTNLHLKIVDFNFY